MGTGIAQRKGMAGAITPDDERNLKELGFVKLIAGNMVGRQSTIPEAGEHQRIRRLAVRRVKFGHEKWLMVDFRIAG